MNSSKKLPICKPIITSYPEHSFLLAIIQNADCSENWILENYLQVFFFKNEYGYYTDFFPHSNYHRCPLINIEYIEYLVDNIENFVIDSINQEKYIVLRLDRYYIHCAPDYMKEHRNHPTIIFGYDREHNIINVADFYKDDKYTEEIISFEELYNAYEGGKTFKKNYSNSSQKIMRIILNNNNQNKLRIDIIKQGIEDYLIGKKPAGIDDDSLERIEVMKIKWGIDVYDELVNLLETKEKEVEPKHVYVLKDYIYMMLLRIDKLVKSGFLNKKYITDIKNLYEDIQLIMNMVIKLNIFYRDDFALRIAVLLKNHQKKEKEIFSDLVKNLANLYEISL